jgi:hypothetical protein
MSSVEERLKVTERVPDYNSNIFHGSAVEMITRLQALEEKYPGCFVVWDYECHDFCYTRLENDGEYSTRIASIRAKEERKKQKELDLLAKLKAKHEEK